MSILTTVAHAKVRIPIASLEKLRPGFGSGCERITSLSGLEQGRLVTVVSRGSGNKPGARLDLTVESPPVLLNIGDSPLVRGAMEVADRAGNRYPMHLVADSRTGALSSMTLGAAF